MNNLTPQQAGWLTLADIKATLFKDLERAELQVQDYINGIEDNPLDVVQSNIKNAKTVLADAKAKRLEFTRLIDEKLTVPSMLYEKRMLDNINTATTYELELRKLEESRVNNEQAFLNEVSAYRTHIVNEWFRIAAEYRNNLEKGVRESYTNCLRDRHDVSLIPDMVRNTGEIIAGFKLPPFNKFNRVLITDGQAKEIYDSIEKYDPSSDLKRITATIEDVWATYPFDLANAENAIKAIEEATAKKEAETLNAIALEVATNTLIAQSETLVIDTPKVKRELKIVVVESEEWAKTIILNFVRLLPNVAPKLRVKSWAKLSIGQMADALSKYINETGETINGLKTEEVCK